MKNSTMACLFLALSIAHQASANIITNGNFSDCSYSGWMKDTDGFGDISTGLDFRQAGTTNCAAQLTVDSTETDAFFANTLFQGIDLTAGLGYSLSFDLMVDSELTSADSGFVADYFVVGFGDGSGNLFNADGVLGGLLEADIDGAQNYSFEVMLDDALASLSDLTLEFQLLIGADIFNQTDASASFMYVDNVAINEINATGVSEPFSAVLFGLGVAGMTVAARKRIGARRTL